MDNWAYFDEKYGEPFGCGAQCHVYRRGDTVYKVLKSSHTLVDAMREGYSLAIVESLGVPTSNLHGVYREEGHVVIEMDYVSGRELMDAMIDCAKTGGIDAVHRHIDAMADIHIKMHAGKVTGLENVLRNYRSYVRNTSKQPERVKARMLDMLDRLPDGDSFCHNDYHPRNILYDGTNYTVIDWDSAGIGDPAGDVAHSYVTTMMSSSETAEYYLEAYLSRSGMARARIEPWIPFHSMVLYDALGGPDNPLVKPLIPFIKDILA